ncbi:type II toxin-antitoxin system death-on-curing family toxin [Paracoccus methylarcula]|uniref:Type II toxin-antitoxin system death-on-curing family toxin n=1 Tax=Paracoccus methylarcula TaxID=72022 RepID=A0A3R7MAJ4_9RHOB|nr:type II toxin-antitoxin system death-on-curing family toxin [Paracoccus methylarcula]RNF35697.1 type II toxin-antitoxin system death-on-curing family toxin [Paracoccus methylarcula]
MELLLLTAELVEAIHDEVLNPGELPGMAMNKSLDSALARVENRIAYGMVDDLFDIAAMYAMAISQGHCFNDANKRTAHQSMDAFLDLNGVQITWSAEEIGQKIIALAQGLIDDGDLAEWLRGTA